MREYEKKLSERNEAKVTKHREENEIGEVSSSAMDRGDESSVNSDSVPVSVQGVCLCMSKFINPSVQSDFKHEMYAVISVLLNKYYVVRLVM